MTDNPALRSTADDELSLVLSAQDLRVEGWQAIRVTRGCERLPNDFDIAMTERFASPTQIVIPPGSPCKVLLGRDVVVTGYVDRYMPSIGPDQHQVRVVGRGRCQDFVDCSIEWPNSQISNSSVLQIAKKLGKPYGIDATLKGVDEGPVIPMFSVNFGETPLEVIERLARFHELLVYEGADGNLILAQVATEKHASGFAEGVNVESAEASFGMDLRYSEYVVRVSAFDIFQEGVGPSGEVLRADASGVAEDPGVPRHRRRTIIAEADDASMDVVQKRGRWEANRRFGRSFAVRLTTDNWRDSAGRLWEPNTLVDVDLPSLKIVKRKWVIADVSYEFSLGRGTTATLTLMPAQAFAVQPILIAPQPLRDWAPP